MSVREGRLQGDTFGGLLSGDQQPSAKFSSRPEFPHTQIFPHFSKPPNAGLPRAINNLKTCNTVMFNAITRKAPRTVETEGYFTIRLNPAIGSSEETPPGQGVINVTLFSTTSTLRPKTQNEAMDAISEWAQHVEWSFGPKGATLIHRWSVGHGNQPVCQLFASFRPAEPNPNTGPKFPFTEMTRVILRGSTRIRYGSLCCRCTMESPS